MTAFLTPYLAVMSARFRTLLQYRLAALGYATFLSACTNAAPSTRRAAA